MSDPSRWDSVARHHVASFVSPVTDAEGRPLQRCLAAIPKARRGTVADLGCGSGPLLVWLAARFPRVVAIDGSAEMLRLAKARFPGGMPTHVELHQGRLDALKRFRASFDQVVVANAVLTPNPLEARRILRAICGSLRPSARMFMVLPAAESLIESARFLYEAELRRGPSERAAVRRALRHLRDLGPELAFGVLDNGLMRQRHWTQHDIASELARAGFAAITTERIRYPRRIRFRFAEGHAGAPPVWHWLIGARRADGP